MANTKRIPIKNQDKHLQRCGLRDLRGSPTKNGAGKGNWGTLDDEVNNYQENSYEPTGQVDKKIQVLSNEEYIKLKSQQ